MTYALAASGILPDQVIIWLGAASPDLPPEAWWLIAATLAVLAVASVIDAFTGIVPDALIFPALIGLIAGMGFYISWPFAAHHLLWGLGAAFILWLINEIWFRLLKQDAFGMGDVKWSVLAATVFSPVAVLIAWGAGACLAVLWLGGLKLARRPAPHVHFAPFLMIGLLGGIYWLNR